MTDDVPAIGDTRALADRAVRAAELPPATHVVGSWSLEGAEGLAPVRARLGDCLRHELDDATSPANAAMRHQLLLVASELATNGLRHGRPPVHVHLLVGPRALLLDVVDLDPTTLPLVAGRRGPGAGGFGLMITESLSTRFGCYVTAATKHVWASFVRQAGVAGPGTAGAAAR
ncbi:ATP-binding protein [Cellulomonas endophytica]|uniref:ATP-binding protein n=1 Tax=Cellulomonas endophytica TaxID=2494735 RepID=UPI001012BDA2|nr:ATP-binding protein [Cellulomonas endophytica]